MSLTYDRRSDIGHGPGTHALICGVGRYPFADEGDLVGIVPTDDPRAVASAVRMRDWLLEHADDLAAPLATCRVLLSGGQPGDRPATLVEFLRGARAWRDDASRHPDGMAVCYLVGHGVRIGTTGTVLLLEDFGDRVGGILHNAIDVRSLLRGMAPTSWTRDIARTQVLLVDACGSSVPTDTLRASEATAVFDAPLDSVDDHNLVLIESFQPAGPLSGDSAVTWFCDALIECLDGAAAEQLPEDGWAVTTIGLGRSLRRAAGNQPGGPHDRPAVLVTSTGEPALVVRPPHVSPVPVRILLPEAAGHGVRLIMRDDGLREVSDQEIPEGTDTVKLELDPGIYVMEVSQPGGVEQRAVVTVQPPGAEIQVFG